MHVPAWFWWGTPVRWYAWLVNRLLAWAGLFYLRGRVRTQRAFWVGVVLINVVSLSVLAVCFHWLR